MGGNATLLVDPYIIHFHGGLQQGGIHCRLNGNVQQEEVWLLKRPVVWVLGHGLVGVVDHAVHAELDLLFGPFHGIDMKIALSAVGIFCPPLWTIQPAPLVLK